jgi:stress-induced morphogen
MEPSPQPKKEPKKEKMSDHIKRLLTSGEDGLTLQFFSYTGQESGCGLKAAAVIVSNDFEGMSRVKRSKLV